MESWLRDDLLNVDGLDIFGENSADAAAPQGFLHALHSAVPAVCDAQVEELAQEVLSEVDVSSILGKRCQVERQLEDELSPGGWESFVDLLQPKRLPTDQPAPSFLGSFQQSTGPADTTYTTEIRMGEGNRGFQPPPFSCPPVLPVLPPVSCTTYQREKRFSAWHAQEIPWSCLWTASFKLAFSIVWQELPAGIKHVAVTSFFYWPNLKETPKRHSKLAIYGSDPYPRGTGAVPPLATDRLVVPVEGPCCDFDVFVVPAYVPPKKLRPVVGLRVSLLSDRSDEQVVWEQTGFVRSRKPQLNAKQ